MATVKGTTPKSGRSDEPKASRPKNTSLPARTARTVKERPYTSAAIATGAIAAVAAAAAGAVLLSRRDKSLRETGEDLAARVKDGIADATGKIKTWVGDDSKSQQQIAEEALTLKETGAVASPVDTLASDQISIGAVA